MTGYLQRLMDRGAALAAVATPPAGAADVVPGQPPGSPLLSFDQRMAARDLAQDFGILGLSPEMPDAADAPADSPAPEVGRAFAVTAPQEETTRNPSVRAEAIPIPVPTEPLPPVTRAPIPEAAPDGWTAPAAAPPAIAAAPAPMQAAPTHVPADRPALPGVVPHSAPAMPPGNLPAPAVAARATRPRDAMPPAARPDISGTTLGRTMPAVPARPLTASPPPSPVALPPPPEVRPAPTVTEVRPPQPAPPPPLQPPAPPAPDAALIGRLVREALDRERAQAPQPAIRPPPGTAIAPEAAPPRRPATAQEASVIGDLEPSSRPIMIYGMRRR